MNEQREPSPTQSSHDLRPDRTTVHIEPSTVGEADDSVTLTASEADETEALTGDATDSRPTTTQTESDSLESPDPSLSSQALGFELRADASDPAETVDVPQGLSTTKTAPRGESIDPDKTVDVTQDDRTTPPTEDLPADRQKSRKPRGAQIGPDLPGYVVLEVIGRGGMGVVYKARQIALDRLVALKMVLAGAHASPEQLARFSIESQAVAQLQHPGIVQIHEVGEHDGLPYFSLEFVAGGSLAKKIGGKPQPTLEAAGMVRDLALAMREAHRRNIIHRDLKPANVLLTPDDQPKITDFGLAKRLDADSQQTHTGVIMGTPSYMAPEQAWGQTHQIGPLTDLYALGAILYEMLVGRPPFQGASALETIELVRTQEPVPPTRLQPKIPVDLETICLKCLQKDPAKRYSDASALADDLQRFLEGRPILARPVGAIERLARWCRRNPKVAALAATVAALLVIVTAVSSYSAVSLDRLNGQLVVSIKAESAARQAAQTNARDAIKARDRETEARKQESEARQKAEKVITLALEQDRNALESQRYISVLIFQRLRDFPGTQDLRDELIQKSVKGVHDNMEVMDQLGAVVRAKDKEGAALATRTLAGIYQRAGGLMADLGRYDEATRYYRQMDELAESLAADNPGSLDARRPLASSKITLGEFEMNRLGDSKAALGHLEQNLAIRREFLAHEPQNDEAKRGVCNALGYLARVWLKLGDPFKAKQYYNDEVALRDQIGPELAGVLEVRRERAGLEEKLGDLNVALSDNRAGRDHYDRALTIREETSRENPGDYQAQRDLLLSYKKIGTFYLLQLKDPAAARVLYEKALAEFESRLQAEPDNVVAQEDVAVTQYYVATAALRAGDSNAAALHYKACLAIREGLAGNPKAKLNVIDLMIARARCGQHQIASQTAEEIIRNPPLDARVYFQAACGFSLCAGAVAAGAASPEAKALAERYTGGAFKSLRLALGAGWKNLVEVETDPDLDAIREAPGFAAVVAEYRKAVGK
jgi:eukaryotic-like serine/threonine-protein kinase